MKLFGLIGYPLSHSFSKKYFTSKFSVENIPGCRYENFPLENISQIRKLLEDHPELQGLNVTIPYKEKVIPFLDQVSPVVSEINACNCISVNDGYLSGYNTDVAGFSYILHRQLKPIHTQALILGTGGASKAVEYVLTQNNINWKTVSRTKQAGNLTYSELDAKTIGTCLLIVNTTPVGMYPDISNAPEIPYHFLGKDHLCIDLIYNPEKTRFLKLAEKNGASIQNGADMLVVQAEESWKIWNS